MKPILVGDCNNYSFDTNSCTTCGRSMPDLCVEYEEMKRKAEAYDAQVKTESVTTEVDPYVQKAASRKPGRPPKAKI